MIISDEWTGEVGGRLEPVSPSGVAKRQGPHPPRSLKIAEIHQIVRQYGEAARRVREAGCDGIEIAAGMGLLINQFLSPVTNKRTDEYGGSFKSRLRFLQEIISEVKGKGGGDLAYLCRISGEEFMDGGLTLKETAEIAKNLEHDGIQCLNVQAGWHESTKPLIQSSVPPGSCVYIAESIKKVVNIPVIAAYRITTPELAEEILLQGKADLVGMSRALIADPEFPRKAKEGREQEIRPCIACCRCLDRIIYHEPLECTVNPWAGREAEWLRTPAAKPKKVLVIGGGPAGMVASTTASRRGHQVILYEKQEKLGGQLNYAALAPFKQEIAAFKKYLEGELNRSNVEVKLKASAEATKMNPDVVIIAAGAHPLNLKIPGIEKCITALDVLSGKQTGERVLVIGGGMIGCEVAEYLAGRGKKVIILEMLKRIGADIGPSTRWVIIGRLRDAGVRIETNAKAIAVTESGVRVERDGKQEEFHGDTVVLAAGMSSVDGTPGQIKAPQVYRIGDCVSPRKIKEAVEEGTKAALEI